MNEEFKASNKLRDENRGVLDNLEEQVQTIKKVIGELYQEKSDLKEAFYKAKYDYEIQQQVIRHRDFIIRRKTKLENDVKYEKEREEKRIAERAAIPNPFEDEIENCNFLANYLKKLKRDREAKEIKQNVEEVKKETESIIKGELEKQAADGKLQFYTPVTEEETTLVIGGGRGKGKKNRKKKEKKNQKVVVTPTVSADSDDVNLSLDILRTFAIVRVEAPTSATQLAEVIEKLEAQAADWEQKGQDEINKGALDKGSKDETTTKKSKPSKPSKYNGDDETAYPTL